MFRLRRGTWTTKRSAIGPLEIDIVEGFGRPFGVSIDGQGFIYVADFDEHRIVRFSPSLEPAGWLGEARGAESGQGWRSSRGRSVQSSAPGGFFKPHSVDFDASGNLYVTEYGNRRIQVFDPAGRCIGFMGASAADTEIELAGPATAYFDDQSRLLVADYGAHRVVAFGEEGELIGWIGARADGGVTDGFVAAGASAASAIVGGFDRPHMARAEPEGNICVADTWNHRLQELSPDGRFRGWIGADANGGPTDGWQQDGPSQASSQPGGFHAPVALDFDSAGNFAVAEYGNPRIQLFNPQGRLLGWFGGRVDGGITESWEVGGLALAGDGPGMICEPYDVKLSAGCLYIADTGNRRLQIIRGLPV
ncbi:MAG: NHL repeat-containing protein [Alphaproteobacteria bacterium]|nr:NHL repeat-containing protein [Alphaproteobacteria bacterium]